MSTDVPLLPDPTTLPDDPAVLKQLILQLFEVLQKERHDRERIEHHMDLLLRRLFGRTSEKLDPRQGLLFEQLQGQAAASRRRSSGRIRFTT